MTNGGRMGESDKAQVPQGLVTASQWAWRVLVVGAVVAVLWLGLKYFSAVAIPLAVAILLTALLHPLAVWLRGRPIGRWRVAKELAAIGCLLALALVVGGILAAIGTQIAKEWPQLSGEFTAAVRTALEWLASGPLQIDQTQIDAQIQVLTEWINNSRSQLAGMVASAGASLGHFFAGLAIALIATFFFLADGERIWASALTLVPAHYRPAVERASHKGWESLVAYMRAQVLVALVDALGILVGALILRVPMAWALFAFTFITAFIPVVGAFLAGTLATALALLSGGWVTALIMLGVTVLVVECEGHFLQPILLGHAVSLHPLAVLVGLAVGATIAGIVGALLVIPVLAFCVAFIRGLDPAHFNTPGPATPATPAT
ncbi:MAG: AI-2E family transporter [Propionibacteriaceae bacterium]|nr:AI-2E family transporter [Propionibacteriaceae bacterium]